MIKENGCLQKQVCEHFELLHVNEIQHYINTVIINY